jgi:hypothetical protein
MNRDSFERRSFFTRMNAGVASFAALAGVAMAKPKSVSSSRWEPARHEKDDWLDQIPGKHRMVFDTTAGQGLGDALFFANNYIRTSQAEYGLDYKDMAVLIIVRHGSTPFGYSDAMWAKYGMTLAQLSRAEDPKTKQPPGLNLFNADGYGNLTANRGVTIEAFAKMGGQLGVCAVATRALAGMIANADGANGNPDTIFKELTSNLISSARMVPAGIIAVNRAQERGYSLVTT